MKYWNSSKVSFQSLTVKSNWFSTRCDFRHQSGIRFIYGISDTSLNSVCKANVWKPSADEEARSIRLTQFVNGAHVIRATIDAENLKVKNSQKEFVKNSQKMIFPCFTSIHFQGCAASSNLEFHIASANFRYFRSCDVLSSCSHKKSYLATLIFGKFLISDKKIYKRLRLCI